TIGTKVRESSSQLGSVAQSLAQASTEQASSIQQSVSAMTEVGAMLGQTARNVSTTADLSKIVLDQAQQGVRTMEEMSVSMQAISGSSNRLREIVRVIEDISLKTNVINDVVFKTQLLAVNASIEAARAGQHGKGFAVVANEVASLAAMSGNASNQIKELLRNSTTKVEDIISGTSGSITTGEKVSERTSVAFSQITQSISEVSQKMAEIDAATQEQEAGVSQTSIALTQMNQATTAANSMAQRNAAMSGDLRDQAKELGVIGDKLGGIVSGRTVSAPDGRGGSSLTTAKASLAADAEAAVKGQEGRPELAQIAQKHRMKSQSSSGQGSDDTRRAG
ncbi:hypothetical protein E3A20_16410, partial [Planctomyces bekefii]